MVSQAILYVCALILSLYLLLTSRHLVTFKRWYDFTFLQALAFFFWGLGHLFGMSASPVYQICSDVIAYFYYLFFFFSIRSFPLLPHLYYNSWKTWVDMAAITVLYLTNAVTTWLVPSSAAWLDMYTHLALDVILASCVIGLLLGTGFKRIFSQEAGSIVALLCFLGAELGLHYLPMPVGVTLFLVALGIVLRGHHYTGKLARLGNVNTEYSFFYEKLEFNLRDEKVVISLLFLAVLYTSITSYPSTLYLVGNSLLLSLWLIRWYLTNKLNRRMIKQIFEMSSNLEKSFEENLEQLTVKNEAMSHLLTLKQTYEKLLRKSNEQSMREITYENVYQMIEEITGVWYSSMEGVTFLRVSFECEHHRPRYEVIRGNHQTRIQEKDLISVRLVVDENGNCEDRKRPKYVRVQAVPGPDVNEQEQTAFLNLLAIHARGLMQRCIQLQKSLDLHLMEQEMQVASQIQFSLIPKERLVLPQVEAKAVYIPATYVGGDYVDYVVINERYSCYLVADISGHGLPASLLTTGIRNSFRAMIQTCHEPHMILERLNRLLYEDLSRTRSFVTMFIAVVDHERGVIRTSRAGHPHPLYLSGSRQQVMITSGGIGLGLLEDAVYRYDEHKIQEDFLLVIYTDGLTDLGRGQQEMDAGQWLSLFGSISRTQLLGQGTDAIDNIEQIVVQTTKQKQQDDDISLLILNIKQPNPLMKGGNADAVMPTVSE
ncbi:PP2C family protein-serine/threonine phosphatase [Brevibacillus dissolubilis]|uniref:PP2C family protein-serine/threonine phosphatase n=1 Tax=Brevibacillus dissolubilis TaxID=1844116 RepID=UPI001116616A|nr:PP2C family protein-serine/threonine phosphatase [Brevibacillus dissolubilis]